MNAIANTCERLIQKGRTAQMEEKLSKLLAFDQLSAEEYEYLMGLLKTN